MINKSISRISAIMIAISFVSITPHSAFAGGYGELKAPKITGQIVIMNGKMAPKQSPNKSSGVSSTSAGGSKNLKNLKVKMQIVGMNGKMAPKKR